MTGDHAFRRELRAAAVRRAARANAPPAETLEVSESDDEAVSSSRAPAASSSMVPARPIMETVEAEAGATLPDQELAVQVNQLAHGHMASACRAGDEVQQKVLLLALAAQKDKQGQAVKAASSSTVVAQRSGDTVEVEVTQACTDRLLFQPGRRCLTSLTAEAELLGVDRSTLRSHLQTTAAAVKEAACNAWSGFLFWLEQQAFDKKLKLRTLIQHRTYDETPLGFGLWRGRALVEWGTHLRQL